MLRSLCYRRVFFYRGIPAIVMVFFQILPAGSLGQRIQPPLKPDQFRAINFSADDGVDPHENFVLKDAKGFLWVGPRWYPLSRFDGARFKNYTPDKINPERSIPKPFFHLWKTV